MSEKLPFEPLPPPPRRPFLGRSLAFVATTTLLLGSALVVAPLMILLDAVEEMPSNPLVAVPLYLVLAAGFLYSTPTLKRLSRKGHRMAARRALSTLERDPRPPVLVLRSFDDDELLDPTGATYITGRFEESLVRALRRIGPVVALARPGVAEPELGAARLFVRDEDWQLAIRHFMARAAAVVLIVGQTPGLRWEIKTAARSLDPERLLFVFPYVVPRRLSRWYELLSVFLVGTAMSWIRNRFLGEMQTERERRYEAFCALTAPLLAGAPPEALEENVCLVLDADGTPRFLDRAVPKVLFGRGRAYPQLQLSLDFRRELAPFLERLGVRRRWWLRRSEKRWRKGRPAALTPPSTPRDSRARA